MVQAHRDRLHGDREVIEQYAETAKIKTTGEAVTVIRRQSIRHDEAIMAALERADCFVIGAPYGFRFRRPNERKFTRPARDAVFIVKDDAVTAILPGPYFYAHYQVIA